MIEEHKKRFLKIDGRAQKAISKKASPAKRGRKCKRLCHGHERFRKKGLIEVIQNQ